MAKKKTLRKGDKVEWETSQGKTRGKVVKKVTRTTKVEGHTAKATKAKPQYKVKSDKTGKTAVHKAAALKKVSGKASTRKKKRSPKKKVRKSEDENKQVVKEFKKVVNMTSRQLEKWLASDESKEVGWTSEGQTESGGHQSGRRIIKLLGKKKADYTKRDYQHMQKVVGYVHRHMAQRPKGNIREAPWRYSLMNWGHDPAKKK
jgi:hypothetical protein